jgi:hypothetical protein
MQLLQFKLKDGQVESSLFQDVDRPEDVACGVIHLLDRRDGRRVGGDFFWAVTVDLRHKESGVALDGNDSPVARMAFRKPQARRARHYTASSWSANTGRGSIGTLTSMANSKCFVISSMPP